MLDLGTEDEDILVGKLESWKGSWPRSRGVGPLFAYGVDGFLELVPLDECTGEGNKDDKGEQDECSGPSNTDVLAANVIYNSGGDGADGWEWELRGVEV